MYDYSYFLANNLYFLILFPVLILSFWAQAQVSGNFKRYSKVTNRRGLTGAQAAQAVLRAHGVTNVGISHTPGTLSDHYNPRDNTIYLSDGVYSAATVAAVGVACHEAGHAVQYAVGYSPVRLRQSILPLTQFGARFSVILLMIGLLLYSQGLFAVGIILFSLTTFFQLVTLPVEFNASARAIETIEGENLLDDEEVQGAKKVLRAAALTYVAALLMSIVQLLRYVLIFASRGDRRGGRR